MQTAKGSQWHTLGFSYKFRLNNCKVGDDTEVEPNLNRAQRKASSFDLGRYTLLCIHEKHLSLHGS